MTNQLKKVAMLLVLGILGFGCSSNFSTYTSSSSQSSSSGPVADAPGAPNVPAGPHMQLSWKSNVGEQQGFYIEQSTDGVSYTQIQDIPDGVNTTNVNVTRGQMYYFRIRGYNQAGPSAYSTIVMGSL